MEAAAKDVLCPIRVLTMEQQQQPAPAPAAAALETKPFKTVYFDAKQRATILRAYAQFNSICDTVASCMGIGQCALNKDMTGFLVADEGE
jgi:hypothetical protein